MGRVSDDELMARIESVRFTPVQVRAGYDMGDVDGLLDHLQAAVRAAEPLRPIVDLVRLRTTKLRQGYDIEEVDAFLESIAGPATPTATRRPRPRSRPPPQLVRSSRSSGASSHVSSDADLPDRPGVPAQRSGREAARATVRPTSRATTRAT